MPSKITKPVSEMVAEANRLVQSLSGEEARRMLGQEDVVFVDLRDPREVKREGGIPGAFHCPRGMLEFWIDPASPYAKPVFQEDRSFVFYCASGWRSALATRTAQEMGLAPVAHIRGGFHAWKEAGGPVAIPEPKAS